MGEVMIYEGDRKLERMKAWARFYAASLSHHHDRDIASQVADEGLEDFDKRDFDK